MKVVTKILLFLELIFGFGLLLNYWLLGLIMSPLLVAHLVGGDVEAFLALVVFTLGTLGLWGMLQISLKILFPNIKISRPDRLKKCLLCGYIANLSGLVLFGVTLNSLTLIFILPLLVATHFIYIKREYLWKNSEQGY